MLANREKEEFYDPATKKLKPRYAWYPTLQHTMLVTAKALVASEEELLAAIRARQHPKRCLSPKVKEGVFHKDLHLRGGGRGSGAF